jgi:hypothetical protein
VKTGATELLLDDLPDSRALLHHDQRLGPEVLEPDLAARTRMIRRDGEDDLVAGERLEDKRAVAAPRADDAELEPALCHPLDDRVGVCDGKGDAQVRMRPLEFAEEERDEVCPRARRGPERERAGERALAERRHVLEELRLELEHPLCAPVEALPGFGRLDPSPGSVEKFLPEPFLEPAHLEADSRLRHAEPLRRLGEAPPVDDGAERSQLPRVHKPSLYLVYAVGEPRLRGRCGSG